MMHVLHILAEAKIRQWESDVREGRAKAPGEGDTVALDSREPFEKQLYRDIRVLIVSAYREEGAVRARMLDRAAGLQVQLAARLEKSGYNMVSKLLADALDALRAAAQSAAGDPAGLAATLAAED